jgi:hypothetical protein
MKTVLSRIAKLEDRLGTAAGKQQLLFVVCHAGMQQALAQDKYIEILRGSGFLPTGPVGLVSFLGVPGRLTAEETEKYFRKHAAEICDPRRSLVRVDREANDQ